MKIRTGFVSNSSSSSFICKVCGEVVSGMDMSIREAEMATCENAHMFCTSHIVEPDFEKVKALALLEENTKDFSDTELEEHLERVNECKTSRDVMNLIKEADFYEDFVWDIPAMFCPICSLKYMSEKTILSYMLNIYSVDVKDLEADIISKFNCLQDLEKSLEG